MYTVTMEKECGCFKRSDYASTQSFDTKDAALLEAQQMAEEMNETFCQKHTFSVREEGNNFIISLALA